MLRRSLVPAALTLAAAFAVAAPAPAAVGPDYVTSDNVEFVRSIKTDVGLTAGANIVGNRLFVTSAKNLAIYDITRPDDPQQIGLLNLNVAWENEEVPTNGRVLAISNDWFQFTPSCTSAGAGPTSCLQVFDVRDPAGVKELKPVPQNGDHTSTCVLDCQYLYGSEGSITDLRGVLDGGKDPTDLGSWFNGIVAKGGARPRNCHHVRELRPGIIMTACQPFNVISVLPEHGGSITEPVILATGANADRRFIHSVRWPRRGDDELALTGGEINFNPQCSDDLSSFATWDASETDETGTFVGPLDEVRPTNGTYADGRPPANHLGCSVHWFQEHPTFKNGGLVALAEYENGVRFLQIAKDGQITEQGFWLPLGGSTSSPKWAPGGEVLYAIDYERGIDVLRWKGQTYVPKPGKGKGKDKGKATAVRSQPGRVKGTGGRRPVLPSLSTSQRAAGPKRTSALRAQGWVPGYCKLAAEGKLLTARG
jgi:hypothetical protein